MAVDDISLSVDTRKHFLSKIGERYALQKKSNIKFDAPKSQGVLINEVTKTITMTNDNHTDRTEPVHKAADED